MRIGIKMKKNRINRRKYGVLISNNNHPFPTHGEEGTVQIRLIGRETRGLVERGIIRGGDANGNRKKKCNGGNLKQMKIFKKNIKIEKYLTKSYTNKTKMQQNQCICMFCPLPRGSIQSHHLAN